MTRRDASNEHGGARTVTGAQVVVLAGDRRRRAVHDRARGAEYRSLADADHKARRSIARTLRVIAGSPWQTARRLPACWRAWTPTRRPGRIPDGWP
jgi:hypothetical protein